MRWAGALLTTWVFAGCGASAPPPALDYDRFLRVGVEPAAEADAIEAHLARAGYEPSGRVDAEGWSALAAHRPDGVSVARVVTTRGVVIAIEAQPEEGLLRVDRATAARDADHDGTLDVVIERAEAERVCLLIAAMSAEGGAAPLIVDPEGIEPGVCLEDVRDVDHDGRDEAIVRVRVWALARAACPTIDIPLARDERGIFQRGSLPTSFVAAERAVRQQALEAARATPDAEEAFRLGVELAALARADGADPAVQLAAFDAAMSGVVLSAELAEAALHAHAFIAAGWRAPEE